MSLSGPCWGSSSLVPGEHTEGGTGRRPTESWRAIREGFLQEVTGEWPGVRAGQSRGWALGLLSGAGAHLEGRARPGACIPCRPHRPPRTALPAGAEERPPLLPPGRPGGAGPRVRPGAAALRPHLHVPLLPRPGDEVSAAGWACPPAAQTLLWSVPPPGCGLSGGVEGLAQSTSCWWQLQGVAPSGDARAGRPHGQGQGPGRDEAGPDIPGACPSTGLAARPLAGPTRWSNIPAGRGRLQPSCS